MHLTAHGGLRQSAQMWLGKKKGKFLAALESQTCISVVSTLIQATSLPLCRCKTPLKQSVIVLDPLQHVLPQTLSSTFYPRPSPACFTPTPFALCPNQCAQLAHLCWGMGVGLVLQQQLGNVDVVVVGGHVQRGQAILALHVRVGVLLQQQACHLDVAVLGSDVQRGEALLQWERQNGVCVCKNGLHQYLITTFC